jgi:hypothetical protein
MSLVLGRGDRLGKLPAFSPPRARISIATVRPLAAIDNGHRTRTAAAPSSQQRTHGACQTHLVNSQQPESGTTGGSLDRLVRPLNVLNALVPLGALLLYWSVRSGYDSFYQRFHLTPEQVGIGQVEMIARTAYTLGLLLFLFAGIWISLLVLLNPAEGAAWRSHVTAAVVLGVPALLLLVGLSSRAYSWAGFVPLVVASVCASKSVALYREEQRGQPGWFKRLRIRHLGFFTLPATVLIGLLLLAGAITHDLLEAEAGGEIDDALRGQPRPGPLFALSLLAVQVESVEIVWLSDDVPDQYRHLQDLQEVLYLGQANGSAFFYDHQCSRTVEIPTGTFALLRPPTPPAATATTVPPTTSTIKPSPLPPSAVTGKQPSRSPAQPRRGPSNPCVAR